MQPLSAEAQALVNALPKFICRGCEGAVSKVIDSRYHHHRDAVIRVRQCRLCGEKFETEEVFRRRV
jgi:transcriptional regulator NrdR family protein